MVLQRVRILKVLLTILTLETLSRSVYILHVSVQTVLVKRLVAIRTLDLALLPDSWEGYLRFNWTGGWYGPFNSQAFFIDDFSIGFHFNWTGRCYGPSSDGLCSWWGFCRSSHSADTALLENRRADSSCGEISCSGGWTSSTQNTAFYLLLEWNILANSLKGQRGGERQKRFGSPQNRKDL